MTSYVKLKGFLDLEPGLLTPPGALPTSVPRDKRHHFREGSKGVWDSGWWGEPELSLVGGLLLDDMCLPFMCIIPTSSLQNLLHVVVITPF